MSSFWRNFHHWLYWKLSLWQLPVQPVMIISSKWRHFRFCVMGYHLMAISQGMIKVHVPILDMSLEITNVILRMMTSSNGNIFRVTGHLCGEFTGPRWIPHTKASDAELWCFLWSAINGWVNNREAGDLRRHRGHYDVMVIGHLFQEPISQCAWCLYKAVYG